MANTNRVTTSAHVVGHDADRTKRAFTGRPAPPCVLGTHERSFASNHECPDHARYPEEQDQGGRAQGNGSLWQKRSPAGFGDAPAPFPSCFSTSCVRRSTGRYWAGKLLSKVSS